MEVTDFRWPISAKYGGRPCQNGWSLRTEAVRTMCGQRTAHSPHALTTTSRAGRWMGRTWWCAVFFQRMSLTDCEQGDHGPNCHSVHGAAHCTSPSPLWLQRHTFGRQLVTSSVLARRMAHSESTTAKAQQIVVGDQTPGDEKEERPSLSYKDLITEAIERSPERRLKLSEIYQVE
ncbi:hypothetical protein niasHS_004142 [Heterodera schachtii]|uniref:Fork-head domain-containing protein n=1 Tax=Heterodera schachtii TaxID=97005 RepID=A0ABD2JL85_HETSC